MAKYNLKEDHTAIKEQIKRWELRIDEIVKKLQVDAVAGVVNNQHANDLDEITNEMMAVNI